MEATCGSCGTALPEGAVFCSRCGTRVPESAPAAPPGEAPERPAAPIPVPPLPPPLPAGPPLGPGVVAVRVPRWLAADWLAAAGMAVLALGIGVAIQILLGFLVVFAQVCWEGAGVDWGATMRGAITVFLSLHGPVDQMGLWLTGILWIWVAFRLGGLLLGPERALSEAPAPRRAAFVGKVALLYMIPVTILTAVLDPVDMPLPARDLWNTGLWSSLQGTGFGRWNVAAGFFLGLAAVLAVGAFVLARRARSGLLSYFGLGLRFEWPAFLSGAWAGARRVMAVALPATLVLMVVGAFLELAGNDLSFRAWMAFALMVLYAAVLLAGIDVAVIYFLLSMRFFLGDEVVYMSGRPAWMFVGVAIAVAAFAVGGYQAAKRSRPATAGQAALAGLLVGPFVGVVVFVASWFVGGIGEAIAGPALGLPFLWSLASAAGGLIYANRHGMLTGLRFEVTDRAGVPAPPREE